MTTAAVAFRNYRSFLLALLTALAFVSLAPGRAAWAAQPILEAVDLPTSVKEKTKATLRLRYTDKDGDRVTKALFVDRSASASTAGTEVNVTRKGAGDPETGVVLEWDVSNLEVGSHRSYFEVTNETGQTARFPENDAEFYGFTVESLIVKIGIMVAGMVVGLAFLPFLVYVLSRSINRRGDPSRAARGGLLIGILACGALFIYLFASFYGALAYGIGVIAALALAVIVLTRR